MVKTFGRQNQAQVAQANRQEVRPGDINGATVQSDSWTELFTVASTNTKEYAPGYGTGDRRSSDAGYSDFDLQDSTPNPIDGNFRWVLYESSDHDVPMRISDNLSSTAQRNSVSASLTDKQLVPGRTPAGSQDRELVLEFKADSSSDGMTISPSNCSADSGLPYSMVRQ